MQVTTGLTPSLQKKNRAEPYPQKQGVSSSKFCLIVMRISFKKRNKSSILLLVITPLNSILLITTTPIKTISQSLWNHQLKRVVSGGGKGVPVTKQNKTWHPLRERERNTKRLVGDKQTDNKNSSLSNLLTALTSTCVLF